jgi:hypothetical protein
MDGIDEINVVFFNQTNHRHGFMSQRHSLAIGLTMREMALSIRDDDSIHRLRTMPVGGGWRSDSLEQ